MMKILKLLPATLSLLSWLNKESHDYHMITFPYYSLYFLVHTWNTPHFPDNYIIIIVLILIYLGIIIIIIIILIIVIIVIMMCK